MKRFDVPSPFIAVLGFSLTPVFAQGAPSTRAPAAPKVASVAFPATQLPAGLVLPGGQVLSQQQLELVRGKGFRTWLDRAGEAGGLAVLIEHGADYLRVELSPVVRQTLRVAQALGGLSALIGIF